MDCMMCSIMLHLRPVLVLVITQYGVPGDMFRFGLVAILQQRLLVAREIDAGTAVQRLGRLSKRFVIQE